MARLSRPSVVAVGVCLLVWSAAAQDRGQPILERARQAIGLAAGHPVIGLSATATVRRTTPRVPIDIVSDIGLEIRSPDLLRRTETLTTGGRRLVVVHGIDGNRLIGDDRSQKAASSRDPTTAGPPGPEALRALGHERARLLIVWLLSAPEPGAFSFTEAGMAEAPDGRAHVVDVAGPDGFGLRLFIDAETHRLRMATYTSEQLAAGADEMRAIQKELLADGRTDPARIGSLVWKKLAALPKKAVTTRMRFSDYRPVGTFWFPYRMQVEVEGQSQETWTFTAVEVHRPETASAVLGPPLLGDREVPCIDASRSSFCSWRLGRQPDASRPAHRTRTPR